MLTISTKLGTYVVHFILENDSGGQPLQHVMSNSVEFQLHYEQPFRREYANKD